MSVTQLVFVFVLIVYLSGGGGWGEGNQSLFHLYFVPSFYVVLSLSLDTDF